MTESYDNFEQILQDDADWAAFLYLSNELNDADSERFEDQLAERADLQEALITGTRSTIVAATAFSTLAAGKMTTATKQPAAKQPATVYTGDKAAAAMAGGRFSSFSAMALVCLGLLVGVVTSVYWQNAASWNGSGGGTSSVVRVSDEGALMESEMQVLAAWVDFQPEGADQDLHETVADGDLNVPDWMLTAVLLDDEEFGAEVDSTGDALPRSSQPDRI